MWTFGGFSCEMLSTTFVFALRPQLTKFLFRPVVSSSSPKTNAHVPESLLFFLERLESFPAVQTELKTFWVEELQAKPAKSKKKTPADSELDDSGTDDESSGCALSLRVLNVLHRGVLPHLTRPVMVMDWVGGCVDYGKFFNCFVT